MSAVDYLSLLADSPRVDAFRRAIEQVVSPGRTVLDMGTGVGTYALFAARVGARVYAVEADPIIEVARQLAKDNGLAERIVFLEGWAADLVPPERADVLIFEDFAPSLCASDTLLLLDDLRQRWLTEDAVAVPQRVRLMLAPVSCPADYAALVPSEPETRYGLGLGRLTHRALNSLHRASWTGDALLGPPVPALELDTLAFDDMTVNVETAWDLTDRGTLHGLGLWLNLDLAPGVGYSNSPAESSSSWGQVYLPLTEPIELEPGCRVEVQVRTVGAPSQGGDVWWKWAVRARGTVQDMESFRGAPLSMARLQRARLDGRPRLGPTARMRRLALGLMDGEHTLAEIVETLHGRFPDQLRTPGQAYRFVAGELDGTAGADSEGGQR